MEYAVRDLEFANLGGARPKSESWGEGYGNN